MDPTELIQTGAPALVYLAGVVYLARYAQMSVRDRIEDLSARCKHLEERADACERDRNEMRPKMLQLATEAARVPVLEGQVRELQILIAKQQDEQSKEEGNQ